jgi:hypothetical protein
VYRNAQPIWSRAAWVEVSSLVPQNRNTISGSCLASSPLILSGQYVHRVPATASLRTSQVRPAVVAM